MHRYSNCQTLTVFALVAVCVFLFAPEALAQISPWERAAQRLQLSFTGPIARSLALVAVVIGGIGFMFGESGSYRGLAGIVFGAGLALFASQFLLWLV